MAIFFNEEFLSHVQGPFHPESPERLRGIRQKLKQHDLWRDVKGSKTGTLETLLMVHDEGYIDYLRSCGECSLTLDTMVHHETYGIAALAAQASVDAVKWSKEEGRPSFALVRPPGHHAGKDYGIGFCYFNNIAIATRYLQRQGDKRIAILDVDVHHGNGTHEMFAMDPSVLYISTHQHGIFPGTGPVEYVGKDEGEGYTVNLPFQAGCGDSTLDVAMEEIITPVTAAFKPDAILVSWGMDTHYRDPLASLTLSSVGCARQAEELMKLSKKLCGNRITFMLEGGYDVPALSEVVAAAVGSTQGVEVPLEYTDIMDNSCLGRGTIMRCKQIISKYWRL
ncbi:MAG: histone deacetylase [Candidatus Thermoplasmatota archaeon]|nr:histone deacetylase [Candidatus Thermoplasmatota archaeon]